MYVCNEIGKLCKINILYTNLIGEFYFNCNFSKICLITCYSSELFLCDIYTYI